eukprot:SAG31_NODE_975_length_10623_cov_7.244964_12_plen_101_part_00
MNKLGDEGAKVVAAMLACGDVGAAFGVSMEAPKEGHDPLLEEVEVDSNAITDVGGDMIATSLATNKNVTRLNIRTNYLSGVQVACTKIASSTLRSNVISF